MDSLERPQDEVPVREINGSTDTKDVFAHAWNETKARGGFKDVLIVDVDAHCYETDSWDELIEFIPDEVIKYNAGSFKDNRGRPATGIINTAGYPNYQRANGRITYGKSYPKEGESITLARARAGMDAMGIDYSVVFPTPLLSLGMHRQSIVENNIAWAYNQWMIERVCAEEKRVKSLVYLPFNDPEECIRVVEEQCDQPGVCGAMVTSVRHKPVHHNSYMKLYAMLEERNLPLMFHAGPHWEEAGYLSQLNQFISAHAISFVLCNMVHLTNWIINGLPERFPKLKVGWIESGISWIGFMATRLDSEYMMRTSEAPLLKKLPSEYMREMFYSTQPMERSNLKLLEANFDLIDAPNSILYASDWPHWDFDMPHTIWDLPFLDDQAKRNILGLNSAKLFGIDPKPIKDQVQPPR